MKSSFARSLYRIYQWTIFVPLLGLLTLVLGLSVILVAPLRSRKLSYYLALAWARGVGIITPVRVLVKGREGVDRSASYVMVANHQSYYDIIAMYGWTGIDLKFVMKKELKRIPVFGQACAAKGHVFVDRSDRQSAIDSLNSSVENLRKGESVIIYPEGTRSRDGEVQDFRKGAFRLALATGLPILPVSVAGTDRIQPADTLKLYPGRIGVKLHEPIEVKGLGEDDIPAIMDRTRERIIRGKRELEEELKPS